MTDGERITDADSVPEGGSLLFTVRDRKGGQQREAILVRTDGGVEGWLNYCQHWPGVSLDRGDGADIRNGLILCRQHGATFECDSGRCTAGPCEGDALDALDVRTVDGDVLLDDDAYTFDHLGGSDHDGGAEDPTSDSPFDF
ncbi:hypothetical protein JCM30237_20700 [Halolamina litorea]|uniref:Rieske (2Fe-2S) protein n=1 Tax=Halolamina litorea TaxID=1515593 RepID=A0ABD6BR78_9EURY|nr:Rieske 2Fe-2S domain-containing protein [Halolamina litorea]